MTDRKKSRRDFLSAATATAAAMIATPAPGAVPSHRRVSLGDEVIVGTGESKYRSNDRLLQLPDKYHWQWTHNIAVDSGGNMYVIHEGKKDLKDHPSIFVFDSDGKFVRAFGSQFQGGGHGIEVRKEGKQEFLYIAAYQQAKCFAKMTLKGETVWYKKAPIESGVYADGEDTSTSKSWHRKGFLPTNFAFLDDGGFLLADGYGSFFIHEFDKDANWKRCFGGPGEGKGTFKTSHGLQVDRREGREPSVVVTDRARNTLQRLTLDGDHIETLEGFGKPANIDVWKDLMLVAELNSRLTILDSKNEIVLRLDEGVKRNQTVKKLNAQPDKWVNGEFIAPHDACFDELGNIYVAERVPAGRVVKLTRV